MLSIILGGIQTDSNEGIINNGNILYISPKTSNKTFSGSGGSGTGDFHMVKNYNSTTNTIDPDQFDTNDTANS